MPIQNRQELLANAVKHRNTAWSTYHSSRENLKKIEAALHEFREATYCYKQLKNTKELFGVRCGQAICESKLGNYPEALRLLSQLIKPGMNISDYNMTQKSYGQALYYYSIALSKTGNCAESLEKVRAARQCFTVDTDIDHRYIGLTHLGEGISLTDLQQDKEAIDAFNTAAAIFTTWNQTSYMPVVKEKIGYHHYRAKNYENAVNHLTDSINTNRKSRFLTYYYRGMAYEQLGKLNESLSDYMESIELIETNRETLKTTFLRETYLKDKTDIFARAILLSFRTGSHEQAYRLVQQSKSRGFNEILESVKISPDTVTPQVISELAAVRANIDKIVSASPGTDEIGPLREAEDRYIRYKKLTKEQAMNSAEIKPFSPMPVPEIQSLLDEKTALIEYYLTGSEILMFYMDSSSFIPHLEDFKTSGLINIINAVKTTGVSERLKWYLNKHASFMPEKFIHKLSGKQRIIFIPHMILHHFPFGILLTPNGRYLAEEYEINIINTPRMLSQPGSQQAKDTGKMLVICDPAGNLEGACEEGKNIKTINPRIELLMNKKATKSAILSKLSKPSVLHFACHARIQPDRPLFSYLSVVNDDGAPARIELNEIYDTSINAVLVVLNCCDTGLGNIESSDDVVSFSRAFILAGARNVLVTLWEIHDDISNEFIHKFYIELINNKKDTRTALRIAQLYMINKGYTPYHWSSFQLVGM